jgi:hypothetical protein
MFPVNIPTEVKAKFSGYQIVRAERTNSDKTVIAQGLIGYPTYSTVTDSTMIYSQATQPLMDDMVAKYSRVDREVPAYSNITYGDNMHFASDHIINFKPEWIEFDSPDIVINKPILPVAGAFIELFGMQNEVETTAISGVRGYEGLSGSYENENDDFAQRDIFAADKPRNIETNSNTIKSRALVTNARIFQPKTRGNADGDALLDATKSILEDGQIHNNQCYMFEESANDNVKNKAGLRGTHALLTVEDELPLGSDWLDNEDDIRFGVANYRVGRGPSMYGGSSYEARSATKYYPASKFITNDFNDVINNTPVGEPIPGTSGDLVGMIELLDSYNKVIPYGTTCLISTTKYFDFQIYNYGTKNLDIQLLTLSNTTDWYFAIYPDGVIAPGGTVNGKIIYNGNESGVQSCIVYINNDSYNLDIFAFALGVDYENNPPDYTGGSIDPSEQMVLTPGDVEPEVSTGGLNVFKGDTYISYFAYMRSIYDSERPNGSRIETYIFYPVESTINLHLRLDKMQEYINWGLYRDSNVTDYKLMESVSMGASIYGTNYPVDLGNLYRYNSVYSAIDKSKEFYSKPFDFTNTLTNDTRILASEKKINGEYTDSWTKFKFNNYIDIDSKHNAITRLLTFKNNLYYIQATAVGVASVNQRSLIQDNQPGMLSLGTGGILTRYDYITDKSGSEFYDGIVASDDYIFYVDGRRKRANKLVPGKEDAISVIKGIDSVFDKLQFNNVRLGFDRGYNEVLFAIDDTTIAFNEIVNEFISGYSFSPGKMISIGGDFYTTSSFDDEAPLLYADNDSDKVGYSGNTDVDSNWDYIIIGPSGSGTGLYKHNIGNPGDFYGRNTVDDSYITLIINPAGNQVCVFDNLDLRTESTSSDVDQPDDIFYLMEASNNYQSINRALTFSSGPQNVGTIKRIGRVWRTPILPVVASGLSTNRMIDTYLKVTLRYDNSSGNIFRIHDVSVLFRPANH